MVVYQKETNDFDPLTGTTAAQSLDETTCNEEEKSANATSIMGPQAILTPRPSSHPFQERHLILDQPAKIGRSVARCRPAPNNAIFDCKVLSRNHALIWYEDGKFYLQDTKSSNGTFINNLRQSKGSEESQAREVCSGDIVQFGVDVVENSRKVVHGCIVASLKLYLPDGKEAKASPATAVVPLAPEASVSSQELYQLSQYLQEALHREQVLEGKLGALQKVVTNTQDESDIGWKALIEEDRLLSRIETLESQLQTCGKNATEEKLRDDVLRLQEEKDKYQNTAKESLKKVLQEKLEAIQKVQDLETSLSNAEAECTYLRDVNKNNEQEMQYLLEKNSDIELELSEITKKLQEAEEKYQELLSQTTEDKMEIENKVEEMKRNEDSLSAKIESLEAENDFSKGQLESLKAHFDLFKKSQQPEEKIEKNGLLSPEDEEMDEGIEKKSLVQRLSSEVSRLELELQRVVEENKRNELPLTNLNELKEINEGHHTNGDIKSTDVVNQLKVEIQQLTKLLSEARESKKIVDADLIFTKNQLDEVQSNYTKLQEELSSIHQQLSLARQELSEKNDQVSKLEGLVKSLENKGNEEIDGTNNKYTISSVASTSSKSEFDSLYEQLQNTNQLLKQSQEETEQIKIKNAELLKEIAACQLKEKEEANINLLKEECVRHSSRIEVLESEIRKYRNDNTRLDADNKLLLNQCTELECAKNALENTSDEYWKQQILVMKNEANTAQEKLSRALAEIVMIKERFAECTEEKLFVEKERDSLKEQLQLISVTSKTSYACCIVPVIVLLLATILAFHPSLAYFTATSDHT